MTICVMTYARVNKYTLFLYIIKMWVEITIFQKIGDNVVPDKIIIL